jgi:hypothetical protein
MAEGDPIQFPRHRTVAPARAPGVPHAAQIGPATQPVVCFDRRELNAILRVYGRLVAAGESRDYAIDFGKETASFSIYRRASEVPIYRVEKDPKLARRQGAFSVIAATGLILKRGPDLERVLEVLDRKTIRAV